MLLVFVLFSFPPTTSIHLTYKKLHVSQTWFVQGGVMIPVTLLNSPEMFKVRLDPDIFFPTG